MHNAPLKNNNVTSQVNGTDTMHSNEVSSLLLLCGCMSAELIA